MTSLPMEPTYSSEDLTDKRLATLEACAQSDHEYKSQLAKRKLREFGEDIDISAYSDPDLHREDQKLRDLGLD